MTFIKREKGFTLIELMVVVAILAILAIVAIPRILGALDDARRSEATATATSIANVMARYYIQHEEYPDLDFSDDAAAFLLSAGDIGPAISEYLDLRNPDSIDWGDSEFTETPEGDIHGWEIELHFTVAKCPDGDELMEATITPEHIVWNCDE